MVFMFRNIYGTFFKALISLDVSEEGDPGNALSCPAITRKENALQLDGTEGVDPGDALSLIHEKDIPPQLTQDKNIEGRTQATYFIFVYVCFLEYTDLIAAANDAEALAEYWLYYADCAEVTNLIILEALILIKQIGTFGAYSDGLVLVCRKQRPQLYQIIKFSGVDNLRVCISSYLFYYFSSPFFSFSLILVADKK